MGISASELLAFENVPAPFNPAIALQMHKKSAP